MNTFVAMGLQEKAVTYLVTAQPIKANVIHLLENAVVFLVLMVRTVNAAAQKKRLVLVVMVFVSVTTTARVWLKMGHVLVFLVGLECHVANPVQLVSMEINARASVSVKMVLRVINLTEYVNVEENGKEFTAIKNAKIGRMELSA